MSVLFQGRTAEAVPLYEGARAAHEAAGEGPQGLFWLLQVAMAQVRLGNAHAAEEASRRAVRLAEASEERLWGSYAKWALGYVLWAHGDRQEGTALTRAALEILRGFNDYTGTAIALEVFTWITASQGDHERAAQLLGAAHALTRHSGIRDIEARPDSTYARHRARCEEVAISALGPAGYEKALAEGARHDSPARAIALALDTSTGADSGRTAPAATAPCPLSRRERQVAALVAEGMTNRQIAAQLVLSPRTVDGHMDSIMTKLGCSRRTQVATWWAANQVPTP
ncbi:MULTISPECIES: helix-turn-helix transcriptional regulator [Streptomyces]|nr:helix-turn-helix transcriptional regulator [Streptomyces capitiformicae]